MSFCAASSSSRKKKERERKKEGARTGEKGEKKKAAARQRGANEGGVGDYYSSARGTPGPNKVSADAWGNGIPRERAGQTVKRARDEREEGVPPGLGEVKKKREGEGGTR